MQYNQLKRHALITLYFHEGESFTVLELAKATGCNARSLATLLPKWSRWQLVQALKDSYPRRYSLAPRGLKWIKRWTDKARHGQG
jgi:hypothetical protein